MNFRKAGLKAEDMANLGYVAVLVTEVYLGLLWELQSLEHPGVTLYHQGESLEGWGIVEGQDALYIPRDYFES